MEFIERSFLSGIKVDIKRSAKPNLVSKPEKNHSFFKIQPSKRVKKDRKEPKVSSHVKIDAKEHTILHIDSMIKSILREEINQIPKLLEELRQSEKIREIGHSSSDRMIARKKSLALRENIKDLESTSKLCFYIFKTNEILENYRKLLISSSNEFITIGFSNQNVKDKYLTDLKKEELISRYLCIAGEYAKIENYVQNSKRLICDVCCSFDFDIDINDSVYICNNCRTETKVLSSEPSFKDTSRVNMGSRYYYTKKGHFIEATKRYQGKQTITDVKGFNKVVEILKDEMRKHNLKKARGTKRSVTKDHLYMFLREQKLGDHYDHINLIHQTITGEQCPNIEEMEDKLYDMFDIQEESCITVLVDRRINSLTVNYKLFKLLQKLGHPCKKDDFYILRTIAKKDEHDDSMEEVWDNIGWEWIES